MALKIPIIILIMLAIICVSIADHGRACSGSPSTKFEDVHAQVIDVYYKEFNPGGSSYTKKCFEIRILGEYDYNRNDEKSLKFWDTWEIRNNRYSDDPEGIEKWDFIIVSFTVTDSYQKEAQLTEIQESQSSYTVGLLYLFIPMLYVGMFRLKLNPRSVGKYDPTEDDVGDDGGDDDGSDENSSWFMIVHSIWIPFIVILLFIEDNLYVTLVTRGMLSAIGFLIMATCTLVMCWKLRKVRSGKPMVSV